MRPFVAAAEFATVGVTGLVKLQSVLGYALMIADVLLGFVTLGLLVTVSGQSFARRSYRAWKVNPITANT